MDIQFISESGADAGEPNAHLMRWGSTSILLDCGSGQDSDDLLQGIERPDAIWISHAHLDHCGGLVDAIEKWPRVPVLATATTKRQLPFALESGGAKAERAQAVARRATEIDYLRFQSIPRLTGVRIMALGAGHVAGAAMAVIEIDTDNEPCHLLYTGDFCTHDQAVVTGAGIPTGDFSIDAVVSEAMLANDEEANKVIWSDEAGALVDDVKDAEGGVLVGAGGIGESVEVAALLAQADLSVMVDDYLEPVFEACGLDSEDWWPNVKFGDRGRAAGRLRGGGVVVASGDQFRDSTPAGALAEPLVGDSTATIAVLNRARSQTPAGALVEADSGDEIDWQGRQVELNARVVHHRLINHAPRWQLSGFIRGVDAAQTILVHGPSGSRWALKRALEKDGFDGDVEVAENGTPIDIAG